MQFSTIVAAVLVATAVAAPTNPPSNPESGECNIKGNTGFTVCCNGGGGILGGILSPVTCLVGICGVGGGNAVCCDNSQAGLVNINLLQCVAI